MRLYAQQHFKEVDISTRKTHMGWMECYCWQKPNPLSLF